MVILEKTFEERVDTLTLDSLPGRTTVRIGPKVTIRVTGPESARDQFSSTVQKGGLELRGPATWVESLSVSGSSVVMTNVRGSISMINGVTFINGARVEASQTDQQNVGELTTEITVPAGTNLKLGTVSNLRCEGEMGDVSLNLSGQCDTKFQSVKGLSGAVIGQSKFMAERVASSQVTLSVAGQSSLKIGELTRASINLTLTGQSKAEIGGSFVNVSLDCIGQSVARTNGPVSGSYTASAVGMSSITHKGGVKGQVTKSAVGMSKIGIS